MSLTIAIIVSLCSGISMTDVSKRKAEIEAQHPDAKVSVRIDKTCKPIKK